MKSTRFDCCALLFAILTSLYGAAIGHRECMRNGGSRIGLSCAGNMEPNRVINMMNVCAADNTPCPIDMPINPSGSQEMTMTCNSTCQNCELVYTHPLAATYEHALLANVTRNSGDDAKNARHLSVGGRQGIHEGKFVINLKECPKIFNISAQVLKVSENFTLSKGPLEVSQCTQNDTGVICTVARYDFVHVLLNDERELTCRKATRHILIGRDFAMCQPLHYSSLQENQIRIEFNRREMSFRPMNVYMLTRLTDATTSTGPTSTTKPTITTPSGNTITKQNASVLHPITNALSSTRGTFKPSITEGGVSNPTVPSYKPVNSTSVGVKPANLERGTGGKRRFIRAVVTPVVVAVVVLLLLLNFAATMYRKRHGSRTANQNETGAEGENRKSREVPGASSTPVTSGFPGGESSGRHDGDLTSLQASTSHEMRVYNDVGNRGYHVLFGGKERGNYHEYTMIPENGQSKLQKGGVPSKGHYQELLKDSRCQEDGERKSPGSYNASGASGNSSLDAVEKGTNGQEQTGHPTVSGHVYQALRKDGQNATSNHQGDGHKLKPRRNKGSDQTTDHTHRPSKVCGPEYATLEPNESDQSLNPSTLQDTNGPDYAVLEPDTLGEKSCETLDNAYESPTIRHDGQHGNDQVLKGITGATVDDDAAQPYDVLQRGFKTKIEAPSSDYSSLGPTTIEI